MMMEQGATGHTFRLYAEMRWMLLFVVRRQQKICVGICGCMYEANVRKSESMF